MTADWQRYRSGVVLDFDAPVAAVDQNGNGRVTRSQFLREGELFCRLPPLPMPVQWTTPTKETGG